MAQPYLRAATAHVDQLLPTADAAVLLGLKPQTLRKWRLTGTGPRFVRLGGRVAYRPADIDAWLVERTFASTAEAGARR